MTPSDLPKFGARPKHPPGFRPRRGLNWGIVGLLYTSFYLCRYNLPLANKAISDEFHYSKSQISDIISLAFLAYAVGQVINGLLTDRLGGKKSDADRRRRDDRHEPGLSAPCRSGGILWLFAVIRSIDGQVCRPSGRRDSSRSTRPGSARRRWGDFCRRYSVS